MIVAALYRVLHASYEADHRSTLRAEGCKPRTSSLLSLAFRRRLSAMDKADRKGGSKGDWLRLLLLCAGDIERNPGPGIDQKPTMPQLIALKGKTQHINIVQGIGIKWATVGTTLLDDKDGKIIQIIAQKHGNDPELVNMDILGRWIQGQGIPDCSWRGLLGVLRVHRLVALAEHVEEALTAEEAEQDMPTTLPHPPALKKATYLPPLSPENLCCPGTKKPEPSHSPESKLSPTPTTKHAKHSHIQTEDLSSTTTTQKELPPPPTSQQTQPSSSPPAAQQTESSSPPPKDKPPPSSPHCPPLKPQSAVWFFKEYLVKFYSHPKDPVATWPPSPSKKFINLAVINREDISTEELHLFMLATLNKGVDTILEMKAPMEVEQLMDTKPGVRQQCVLVEGAPGVGKTTLSWEICKRWAEGNLFKQYSLILLLRLRDHTVYTADTIKDLILYPHKERLEDIAQHLKNTDGAHTLILLEGLDELPQHLLSQPSVFTRLLAFTELPHATILVTSRPSATAQLWEKWRERISRHIEILGFTEKNITAYVTSVLGPQELPNFDTYLCTAPSIRQLMYIPLHSGIIVELYRMCRGSDKHLPTNKTTLYTRLVKTILTRYLAAHPKYKDDNIDVEEFKKDLPVDVYHIFEDITELAYESVIQQQLIFKDKDKPIQHLGLMDVVAELFPNKRKANYSYNFLHLSIQEYLGAVHVSLMDDTSKQERLLESMCITPHLKNMALFLAAITKFKGMNWELVKQIIRSECKKEKDGTLRLTKYCLELAVETENGKILHGHSRYMYNLSQYSPFDFRAVGYCIATSEGKWALQLGGDTPLQTTSGVDLLLQALHHHSSNSYAIDSITCRSKNAEVAEHLLAGLPNHTTPLIETLELYSLALQPLPKCLPGLVSKMIRLSVLTLSWATASTLADTLQSMATAPPYTLVKLDLSFSQFNPPAIEALSALMKYSKSLHYLWLQDCGLTADLARLLATGLQHRLPVLRDVLLHGNPLVGDDRAVLDECTTMNEGMRLWY